HRLSADAARAPARPPRPRARRAGGTRCGRRGRRGRVDGAGARCRGVPSGTPRRSRPADSSVARSRRRLYPACVHAARATRRLALGPALAAPPAVAVGWLAVHQPLLAVALAAAMAAAPLALATGLTLRGAAIALALAAHLLVGPLYVQGRAPHWLPLLLDFFVVAAFALLAIDRRAPARAWRVGALAFAALIVAQAFNPLLPSIGYGVTGARPLVVPLLLLVAVGSGQLSRRDERALVAVGVIGWVVNAFFASRQWLVGFSGAELAFIRSTRATYLVGDQIRLIGAMRSNQDFAFLVAIAFPAVAACVLARGRSRSWRAGFALL